MKLARPLSIVTAISMAMALLGQDSNAQAPAPSAAPDNPDLAKYEAFYANEVREKVDEPYQASKKTLNEAYRVSLDNAMKRISAQGLLDEAVALQKETKRFAESNSMPETDEPGTNVEVAKLRVSWRAEASRLESRRTKWLQPVTEAYVVRLRGLEKELTRAVKLDQAQQVRARADALTAQVAQVAVASSPFAPKNIPSTPPVPAVAGATPRPLGFSTAPSTPQLNWLGKTVRIRTLTDRMAGIQLGEKDPIVASLEGVALDASSFKVSKGKDPGTVTFESVAKKGFFLRHEGFRLRISPGTSIDSLFRLEKPMEGNEGLSMAAQNFQTHHLWVRPNGFVDLSKDITEPARAVFILEEVVRK